MLIGQLMSLAAGRLAPRAAQGDDVEMVPCSRVTITAHEPVPTQIDGDVLGTTPLEVDAGTAQVRLIVPRATTGGGSSSR